MYDVKIHSAEVFAHIVIESLAAGSLVHWLASNRACFVLLRRVFQTIAASFGKDLLVLYYCTSRLIQMYSTLCTRIRGIRTVTQLAYLRVYCRDVLVQLCAYCPIMYLYEYEYTSIRPLNHCSLLELNDTAVNKWLHRELSGSLAGWHPQHPGGRLLLDKLQPTAH